MQQTAEIADEMYIAHSLIVASGNGGVANRDEFMECGFGLRGISCASPNLGKMVEELGVAYNVKFSRNFEKDLKVYAAVERRKV